MIRTSSEPCVLPWSPRSDLQGVIILQVDDSLGIGSPAFLEDEDSVAHHFKYKARTVLSDTTLTFNGSDLDRPRTTTIRMRQPDKMRTLLNQLDQPGFAIQRAMAQYVGVYTRPDICAPVQPVATGQDLSTVED